MKTIWTKGLKDQALIEARQDYVGSVAFRERLTTLLKDKADEKRRETRTSNSYENANWALVQADAIGYEKALFEVISLIL